MGDRRELLKVVGLWVLLPRWLQRILTQDPGDQVMPSGWTNFKPGKIHKVIHVSDSDGDDHNDGLTPSTAVKKIQVGYDKLTDNSSDWLLLKRGDTFTEFSDANTQFDWERSGESPQAPMLWGAYDVLDDSAHEPGQHTARPKIKFNQDSAITIGGGTRRSFFAFADLNFFYDTATGNDTTDDGCIQVRAPISYFWVEGCLFDHWGRQCIDISRGGLPYEDLIYDHVYIRRNTFYDIYDQACFFRNIIFLWLEENSCVEVGLRKMTAEGWLGRAPQGFYIQTHQQNVTSHGNIFVEVIHASQQRPAGIQTSNLVIRCALGLDFGSADNGQDPVNGTCAFNMHLDGVDPTDAGDPGGLVKRANGHSYGNLIASAVVDNNYVLNIGTTTTGTTRHAMRFTNCNGVLLTNLKIWNWQNGLSLEENNIFGPCTFKSCDIQQPGTAPPGGPPVIHVRDNETSEQLADNLDFRLNRYFSSSAESTWFNNNGTITDFAGWQAVADDPDSTVTEVAYTDTTRADIANYSTHVGGAGTHDDYKAELIKQEKAFWRVAYMAEPAINWIRAGFDASEIPQTNLPRT